MFRWLLGLPQKDNRQTLARDSAGNVVALEVAQGINHKKIIHGLQVPHRNPTGETRTVQVYNWLGIPRQKEIRYSQYPLTDDPANPLDWEALQTAIAEAQARGLDVRLVSLSPLQEWAAQGPEDATQEARGVVDLRNEWLEEQRRRTPPKRSLWSRLFFWGGKWLTTYIG